MYDEKLLAQRLLLCRRDLDLDQKELGKLAGVSNTYISDIERGRLTNVGIEVITALANALKVSPSYLAGWEENPLLGIAEEKETEEESAPLSDDEENLLTTYRQLDRSKQKILLGTAKLLTEE